MRRQLNEEPVTRAGSWSRAISLFAVIVSAVALLLLREPDSDKTAALTVIASGLALATLAIVVAAFAFIRVWREGAHGLGAAVFGMFIASLLLAYPAYAALRGYRLPAITDVSTDVEQPPAFSRSRTALAARDGRYLPEPGEAVRGLQRDAYTQIAPLTLDVDADEAFELARKAAVGRKWQIVETMRPSGRMGWGRIEAIAKSRVLGLPADVTVRVRPRADGARIDVRSASRLGTRDFGDNADRIREYLDEVANLAIALK